MRNILALALLGFIVSVGSVHAQTSEQLTAQIQALLQQVAQLEQRIQAARTGGTVPVTPTTTSQGSCPTIARNLKPGVSGTDVSALQQFLAKTPALYPEAQITGYFGALTARAVERFQIQQNIVSSGSVETTGFGAVGPATRAALVRVCALGTPVVIPSPPPPTPSVLNCILGTTVLASGETRTLYTSGVVPFGASCLGIPRKCMNGVLSGDPAYSFPTCTANTTPGSCTVDGVTVTHGQSKTFYKQRDVLFGQQCAPFGQTRTCNDGTLSGDPTYRFATCAVTSARSCEVVASSATSTTLTHGAQRSFFSKTIVPYNQSCDDFKLVRVCNDGYVSGDSAYVHPACSVTPGLSCTLDSVKVAHGASKDFYSDRTDTIASCANKKQSRTCTNGVLNGTASYKFSYCAPSNQKACILDGVLVEHTKTGKFYSASEVPFGRTCAQSEEVRTCTNGVLGGSNIYAFATCSARDAAVCTLDGKEVAHGASRAFYSRAVAPVGETCEPYKQIRYCTDGYLSGSGTYQYGDCATQ